METIINQLTALAPTLTMPARQATIEALFDQQCKLEQPFDMIRRQTNGVLTLVAARIACDLGIFKKLAAAEKGCTLSELVQETGAHEEILGPIMRFLAALYFIEERGRQLYGANVHTKALAEPQFEGAVRFFGETAGPVLMALPEHLKEQKYGAMSEHSRSTLNCAFNNKMAVHDFMASEPHRFQNFQLMMTIQRSNAKWFDVLPVTNELKSWDGNKAAFVDIGGGRGHRCLEMKEKFLQTADHLVLQDLPETLNAIDDLAGVQKMSHDFFQPQPVKGAKFYYMSHILHNWSDERSLEILKHTASAMDENSRLLIDDVVVPEVGANWAVAQSDLVMMAVLGAKDRTKEQYRDLLAAAGLKLLDVYLYAPETQDSVIMAALSS